MSFLEDLIVWRDDMKTLTEWQKKQPEYDSWNFLQSVACGMIALSVGILILFGMLGSATYSGFPTWMGIGFGILFSGIAVLVLAQRPFYAMYARLVREQNEAVAFGDRP